MSRESIRQAVETRINSNWNTTPIDWDNVYFVPPNNSPFISVRIIFGEERPASILQGYRQRGFININVFAPEGTGTAVPYGYADTLGSLFRGKQFSGISCEGPTFTRVPSQEKGWFQINVSIPFYSDTIYY
jgi:hypothetical protein